MFKVKVSKSCPYQILSSDRAHAEHGLLLSRTEIDELDSAVSVYSSGRVLIRCGQKVLSLDLETGEISYS